MSGNVIDLSLAILLLPLASFLLLIFIGKRLPRGGDWLGTAILFACTGLAFAVLFQRVGGPPVPAENKTDQRLVVRSSCQTLLSHSGGVDELKGVRSPP